jgi:integrase
MDDAPQLERKVAGAGIEPATRGFSVLAPVGLKYTRNTSMYAGSSPFATSSNGKDLPVTCRATKLFAMKTAEILEIWPRIRPITVRGEKYFQVDARRVGTNGKREAFKTLELAGKRADQLAKLYDTSGLEGLAFPSELRAEALTARKLLEVFPGKTLIMAAEHFREHLLSLQARETSATVVSLAEQWVADKTSTKTKKLRPDTIKGIKQGKRILIELFPSARVSEVVTADIQNYLDKLPVGITRKHNIKVIMSQFFNWCVEKDHIKINPSTRIDFSLEEKDVTIFTPDQAKDLLELCEKAYPKYVLLHAIGLFAGLRPNECRLLKWEQVHPEERTITVLRHTSKAKETRNIHIEDILLKWLEAYKPEGAKGFVTPQESFNKRTIALHVAAGFKGMRQNEDAGFYPKDILRHSYGSYWLAKNGNRAQLAENMGNSVQIIKKHYKQVVSKSAVAAYWKIEPTKKAVPVLTPADARISRAKKLAAALPDVTPPTV